MAVDVVNNPKLAVYHRPDIVALARWHHVKPRMVDARLFAQEFGFDPQEIVCSLCGYLKHGPGGGKGECYNHGWRSDHQEWLERTYKQGMHEGNDYGRA